MSLAAAVIGAGATIGSGIISNIMAERREAESRLQNYGYNEAAAIAADKRTRQLYEDLQSPKALLQQYKEAGLSPSLMFGDGGAGTIGNGAQGAGAAGVNPNVFGVNAMEAAQIGLINAQTEKTKEETKNVSVDTDLKRIEENLKALQQTEYNNEWTIINSTWTLDGKETSIFEIARDCYTYEQFLNKLRGSETDQGIKDALTTEAGQRTARAIFTGASHFHRDIMVLSTESLNAQFEAQITEELLKTDFAKMNAKAAVNELRKNISTDELDARQKEAWNNLLKRLEKTSPTTHDILIVLGMIVNNALTNYRTTPNVLHRR